MDNLDEIVSGLTTEQQLEVTMIFDTLGKKLEHADGVKELKLILEASVEALKIQKQRNKDEDTNELLIGQCLSRPKHFGVAIRHQLVERFVIEPQHQCQSRASSTHIQSFGIRAA